MTELNVKIVTFYVVSNSPEEELEKLERMADVASYRGKPAQMKVIESIRGIPKPEVAKGENQH